MTPGGAITPTMSALSVSLPGIVIRMFITTEKKKEENLLRIFFLLL